MSALIGRYEHSLDPKNRLFVPSRYRDQLATEGGKHFYLAMGLDRCLYLFLPSQWEQFVSEVRNYKFKTPQEKRAVLRKMFPKAADAPMDDQGRILVPQALKEHAGLSKDVTVLGTGTRAELWDSPSLAAKEKSEAKDFQKVFASLDL